MLSDLWQNTQDWCDKENSPSSCYPHNARATKASEKVDLQCSTRVEELPIKRRARLGEVGAEISQYAAMSGYRGIWGKVLEGRLHNGV